MCYDEFTMCVCGVYRTKGRYGNETQQQQQQVADRFTFMSVLVFSQCVVSAAVARLGISHQLATRYQFNSLTPTAATWVQQ